MQNPILPHCVPHLPCSPFHSHTDSFPLDGHSWQTNIPEQEGVPTCLLLKMISCSFYSCSQWVLAQESETKESDILFQISVQSITVVSCNEQK